MIHSFRLRLALLSAILAGLALAAFGVGTWWLIREMKIERIDNEVRSNAEREVSRTRSAEDWQHIEGKLVSSLGVRDGSDLILLVQGAGGETRYRSPHSEARLDSADLPWEAVPNAPANAPQSGERPPASKAVSRSRDGQHWRIGLASTDRARIAVAVNAEVIDADMKGIRNAFLVALPLSLLLVGLASWLFSRRALRPLEKLTAATLRVTAEGLDQRISVQGEDHEFVKLIAVFNGMLERLERSFKQAQRFSADAAHELKTPLAILQGQLERAIAAAQEGSALQAELSSILDEVRRLSTISRKLLLLSQADAGRLSIQREPFDLTLALEDLVEDTRMLAPHLKVTGEIDPGLMIAADGSLLLQLLHNLISNAIKYNGGPGWIRIATACWPEKIEVRVANSSAGIPLAEQGKIFERFYRADPSHSRHIEGVGLGLSVAKEIARAHGGDIFLDAQADDCVQFSLCLPVVVPQPSATPAKPELNS